MVLDADAGTLGFIVDDSFLSDGFQNLPFGVELFLLSVWEEEPAYGCVTEPCVSVRPSLGQVHWNIQTNGVFLYLSSRWPPFPDGSLRTVNSMFWGAKEEASDEQTALTSMSP